MIIWDDLKFACKKCQTGHRNASCDHVYGRPLIEIKSKGRPVTQCHHCRERRKLRAGHSHHRCCCGDGGPVKKKVEVRFTAGVVLVFTPEPNDPDALKQRLEANRLVTLRIERKSKPNKEAEASPSLSENATSSSTASARRAARGSILESVDVNFVSMDVVAETVDVDLEKFMNNPCSCQYGGTCICSDLPSTKSRSKKSSSRGDSPASILSDSPGPSSVSQQPQPLPTGPSMMPVPTPNGSPDLRGGSSFPQYPNTVRLSQQFSPHSALPSRTSSPSNPIFSGTGFPVLMQGPAQHNQIQSPSQIPPQQTPHQQNHSPSHSQTQQFAANVIPDPFTPVHSGFTAGAGPSPLSSHFSSPDRATSFTHPLAQPGPHVHPSLQSPFGAPRPSQFPSLLSFPDTFQQQHGGSSYPLPAVDLSSLALLANASISMGQPVEQQQATPMQVQYPLAAMQPQQQQPQQVLHHDQGPQVAEPMNTGGCCGGKRNSSPMACNSGGCCGGGPAAQVSSGGCCGSAKIQQNSGGCGGGKPAAPVSSGCCGAPSTPPIAQPSGGCCSGSNTGGCGCSSNSTGSGGCGCSTQRRSPVVVRSSCCGGGNTAIQHTPLPPQKPSCCGQPAPNSSGSCCGSNDDAGCGCGTRCACGAEITHSDDDDDDDLDGNDDDEPDGSNQTGPILPPGFASTALPASQGYNPPALFGGGAHSSSSFTQHAPGVSWVGDVAGLVMRTGCDQPVVWDVAGRMQEIMSPRCCAGGGCGIECRCSEAVSQIAGMALGAV